MSLQEVFETFASFGSASKVKEMDNSHFAKMCKECGIVDKVFTTTDVDMLFTKVKAKGERKITFEQFETACIQGIAEKKKKTPAEIVAHLTSSGGPQSSATVAEATRFHDDKSQYTGVYKAGGPTNVDRNSADLSAVTDRRKSNDVRGAVQ
jgi:hypothetical protein